MQSNQSEQNSVFPYNGLKSDYNALAKFVYIYEKEIKNLNSESQFSQKYPQAFNVFKHHLKGSIKYATQEDLNQEVEDSKKYTLYFTKHKFQVWDLCRHLRNSISHAIIEKGEMEKRKKIIIILDKYRGKVTSKGYLDYSSIKEFVIEMIKKYEEKENQ